jgi:hypothetical protein
VAYWHWYSFWFWILLCWFLSFLIISILFRHLTTKNCSIRSHNPQIFTTALKSHFNSISFHD